MMAFSTLSEDDDLNAEINTTPLVDIMLVLLILFIITIPVMHHAVKIDLPRATSQPNEAKPQTITISIDTLGQVYWNEQPLDRAALPGRFAEAAKREPQPEVHIRADRKTLYENVVEVMSDAQASGLRRIGFVTEPIPNHP
ncbi:MAG: biopolymer transporter ExbD [Burkholderiales bacterium]|nr:MAG: biopolymer transporter ExbD [Burkholderiales bacterium]